MPAPLQLTVVDDYGNLINVGPVRWYSQCPYGWHVGGVLSMWQDLIVTL